MTTFVIIHEENPCPAEKSREFFAKVYGSDANISIRKRGDMSGILLQIWRQEDKQVIVGQFFVSYTLVIA